MGPHVTMSGEPPRRGLRPELMILLLLVLAVPIIGWQIYRRVTFEFDALVTALSSHPCAFVSKNDKEYDLTDLSRSRSTCSSSDAEGCQDYHVHRVDNDFYFNVCRNAMRKPPECADLFGEQNVHPSIGYQTGDGVCYYMGQLRSGRWGLLDPRNPQVGLKLTYSGGSPCDGDTRRSTQFHFECNPDAGKGEPVAVFGDCEFVVTWETALACPIRQTQLTSFLWWGFVLVALYLLLGFFYNVRFKDLPPDLGAVPHGQHLQWFGSVLSAIASNILEAVGERVPFARSAILWCRSSLGSAYESIGGEGSGPVGGSSGARKGGILDREGYDQL